jgi:hypothetical protein
MHLRHDRLDPRRAAPLGVRAHQRRARRGESSGEQRAESSSAWPTS